MMKKYNRTFAAALILLLGVSVLPRVVGSWQDKNLIRRPGFETMIQVRLNIGKELSLVDKWGLIYNWGERLPISEEIANLTREEVKTAVEAALAPYYQRRLFLPLKDPVSIWEPFLVQDKEDPNLYGIFWTGTVYENEKSGAMIEVVIDDENGDILSIVYRDEENAFGEFEFENLLQEIKALYFGGLHQSEVTFTGTSSKLDVYEAEGMRGIRCQVKDPKRGVVYVNFCVDGGGFRVEPLK